jgi:chromosome partitioning protein
MTVRTLTRTNRRRARVIAVAIQKGGTGKTTTTVCLARAASVRGLKTLVVDFDSQGNTTSTLAINELQRGTVTIADSIKPDDPVPLREIIIPTIWPGVDLAPVSTDALIKAERLIVASDDGREQRLKEALEPALADYDLVLIDNAPALGMLLVNALTACDEVLVVIEADQYSADGLVKFRTTVNRVRTYYNRSLDWAGILVSKWRNTEDDRFWLNKVRTEFHDAEVWDQDKIPLWSSIKTTLNAGLGLDQSKEARLRVLAHSYRRMVAHWVPDEELTA